MYLELEEFDKCIEDADKAHKINPTSVKVIQFMLVFTMSNKNAGILQKGLSL